jgi:hypothetical protein
LLVLGDAHFEDAVGDGRIHLIALGTGGQRNAALERAIVPFRTAHVSTFVLLLLPALAANGEHILAHLDTQIFRLQTGNLSLDDPRVRGIDDIDGRYPGTLGGDAEKAINTLLQVFHLLHWIPANDGHDRSSHTGKDFMWTTRFCSFEARSRTASTVRPGDAVAATHGRRQHYLWRGSCLDKRHVRSYPRGCSRWHSPFFVFDEDTAANFDENTARIHTVRLRRYDSCARWPRNSEADDTRTGLHQRRPR